MSVPPHLAFLNGSGNPRSGTHVHSTVTLRMVYSPPDLGTILFLTLSPRAVILEDRPRFWSLGSIIQSVILIIS